MATQENTQLRGRVGGLDFFERQGRFFAKSASGQCRQTTATIEQSQVFGRVSRVAALLWQHLKPWSAGYANDNAWNRLNRAIANWVRTGGLNDAAPQNNLPYISGYQFNTSTTVNERLRFTLQVSRTVDGMLALEIPEINPELQIAAPVGTRLVSLKIVALTCTTNNTTVTEEFTTDIQINYNNEVLPARQVALPITPLPAALTVVGLSVTYHTSDNMQLPPVNKPVWMPAGIVEGLFN